MSIAASDPHLSDDCQAAVTEGEAVEPLVSFVVPVKDEELSLAELVQGIAKNLHGMAHEVILIDDGSGDSSWQVIESLAGLYPGVVRGIRFRANRGKAAALAVGFDAARGEIIFTMDADLQDDPAEIPHFLSKLDEGYDLVSGWKQVRHDPWHKVIPSRIFNWMLSRFSRVNLHDHNCGFKCYRRDVAKSIRLFGDLHRMVPALSRMQGFRVTEIPVKHHARRFGQSKYGIGRFLRGFSDMLTIGFLRVYCERPAHFANACAVLYGAVAVSLAIASAVIGVTTVQGIVILMTAFCFVGIGGATVMAGLFSELMIRQNRHRTASTAIVSRVEFQQESEQNASRSLSPSKDRTSNRIWIGRFPK